MNGASPMRAVLLAVRFLLELALLAGSAIVAFYLVPGSLRLPATIATPVVIAVLWGLLLSPKASVPISGAAKLAIEAALFLSMSALLFLIGLGFPALVLALVWAVDRGALALARR